jgi:hypothetical protein
VSWLFASTGIARRFTSEWANETRLVVDDMDFETDDTDGPSDPESWARLTILWAEAAIAGVGGSSIRQRDGGDLVVEIHTPGGNGPGRALHLADIAARIFRGIQYDGLRFQAPRLVNVGERGSWYRMNVVCPFEYDAVHTP